MGQLWRPMSEPHPQEPIRWLCSFFVEWGIASVSLCDAELVTLCVLLWGSALTVRQLTNASSRLCYSHRNTASRGTLVQEQGLEVRIPVLFSRWGTISWCDGFSLVCVGNRLTCIWNILSWEWACNPSTWKAKQQDCEFQASLGETVRCCLREERMKGMEGERWDGGK